MTVFFDLVRVYCTTVGSGGPLALGGAVTFGGTAKAFRSFADAGIPDGAALSWAIEDLGVPGREAGTGTYSAGAGTLTRNTTSSTSGNNPLALSGQAQLYVTALAADLVNASNIASGTLAVARGGTGAGSFSAHGVLVGEGTSAFGIAATGTAGRLLVDQGANADPAFEAMSGDAMLAATGAIAVTKTNGVAFAPSATTDTTNAANISSGTLPPARLPAPTASTLGGIESIAQQSNYFVQYIDTSGVPHLAQPTASGIAGAAALSGVNDANVTIALGGSYSTALLAAASLTLGWTGTLAVPRGGTGAATLTAHGVLVGEGTSAVAATAAGAAGQLLTGQGAANDPAWLSNIVLPAGGTAKLNANFVTVAGSVTSPQTNTAAKMMGMGFAFTPKIAGNIKLLVTGTLYGSAANTQVYQLAYGTGAAPALGAAATGTLFGAPYTAVVPVAGGFYPLIIPTVLSGLTLGTTYWFDLQAYVAGGGGSLEMFNVQAIIEEFFG